MGKEHDFFFIGLGNPGKKFETTPHNMGRFVLDRLFDIRRRVAGSIFYEEANTFFMSTLDSDVGLNIGYVTPKTYMNDSGKVIEEMQKKGYKVENVILFVDSLDLYFGSWNFKSKSGHGGHNGTRSIIEALNFNPPTIKVGVYPEGVKLDEAKKFLLEPMNEEELESIESKIYEINMALDIKLPYMKGGDGRT